MASDAIISLPDEIIVCILEDKLLGFSDVVNFSAAAKSLYEIVKDNNKLWKTKFFQRWPLLEEVYRTSNKLEGHTINWREEAKASLNSRMKLLHRLSLMSSKHYNKQELPNSAFKEFDPLFRLEEGAHPLAYYFLVDELISLINLPHTTSNLTHKYYALKIVRYLKQSHLRNEWQKFISLPPKEQTLERGATIVAQWSQPEKHISYSYISSLLDNIAEQTKEELREQYPDHSIFSTSEEQFTYWKNNIIDDNQWSVLETRQVTDALCKVLFQKLEFHGNDMYSFENSFIDLVLERKRGIPVTLAIVFESVARRLGVRCEPVSFPSHFLLRWKETYGPRSKDVDNFYIDVLYGGKFLTKENCSGIYGATKCPVEKYNIHKPATVVEVVTRVVNNLELAARQHICKNGRNARLRSALELQHMVQPKEVNTIFQLGRIYIAQNMDITELLEITKNMENDSNLPLRMQASFISRDLHICQNNFQPEKEEEPKKRVPGVKYAIGMIMRHKILKYLCVITGWDARCQGTIDWMITVCADEMGKTSKQPFYYIFVDNGSHCYVPEEFLLLDPNPEMINHHAIGKYFCKFNGSHYVPNEEKAREYPEDESVRNELCAML